MDFNKLKEVSFGVNELRNEIIDFKEIKAKEYTSVDEAKAYWKTKFSTEIRNISEYNNIKELSHKEVIDGETYYYDDNGDLYRVGNELLPNCQYEINGYKYKTDEKSRIVSTEGTLHMKNREGRLNINDSIEDIGKGDQLVGDDRGHLIGDQFDGSNGLENMVPQDANINRNDYRTFENELSKEVKDGKKVDVKIEPVYDAGSRRPSGIIVTYSIDGEENIRFFPNGKER